MLLKTFARNAINEDGGIPGFVVLAGETFMFSSGSDSRASFKAFHVSLLEDETYRSNISLK